MLQKFLSIQSIDHPTKSWDSEELLVKLSLIAVPLDNSCHFSI